MLLSISISIGIENIGLDSISIVSVSKKAVSKTSGSLSASTATAAGQILLEYQTVIRQLQNNVLKRNVNFRELRRSIF